RPAPVIESPVSAIPKPSPINDTVIFSVPPDREARLESRILPASATRYVQTGTTPRPRDGLEGKLQRLQASLDRVETRQTATLNALEERYDNSAKRLRGVLADLGLDKGKTALQPGVGGPY